MVPFVNWFWPPLGTIFTNQWKNMRICLTGSICLTNQWKRSGICSQGESRREEVLPKKKSLAENDVDEIMAEVCFLGGIVIKYQYTYLFNTYVYTLNQY